MTDAELRGHRLHRELITEVVRAGCFRPARTLTLTYGAALIAAYAAAWAVLLMGPGLVVRLSVLVTLAFLCVRAGFMAHEAGHGAITRNRRFAVAITQVFDTLLTALAASHFSNIHRRHHPHTNDRSRDPDIQSGFLSMYAESAAEKSGLGAWISRHQAVLIWILVCLHGLSLKVDSLRFIARNPRTTRVDQTLLFVHASLWLVIPVFVLGLPDALLNYALLTLLIGPYTGSLFLVNHLGTRVIEPDESISFFLHELAVTRNLGATRLDDFVFCGLNNHVEHHLFPSMPTIRLRAARRITREFCRRHGLDYREMSWFAGIREVARHFKAMSAYVPR